MDTELPSYCCLVWIAVLEIGFYTYIKLSYTESQYCLFSGSVFALTGSDFPGSQKQVFHTTCYLILFKWRLWG